MSRCWIALGGNQGDVAAAMHHACGQLTAFGINVIRRSPLFDTAPVGAAAGERFLNAAAELETSLSPLGLLAALQQIEVAAGRSRELYWGPRPLDLDLLLFDQRQITSPQLTVPHPALWYRRFVLDPIVCIAADVIHPSFGVTLDELQSRLGVRPLPVAVTGTDPLTAEVAAVVASFDTRVSRCTDLNAAAITLHCAAGKYLPAAAAGLRTVEIGEQSHPLQAARDVLIAALDEPLRLD